MKCLCYGKVADHNTESRLLNQTFDHVFISVSSTLVQKKILWQFIKIDKIQYNKEIRVKAKAES